MFPNRKDCRWSVAMQTVWMKAASPHCLNLLASRKLKGEKNKERRKKALFISGQCTQPSKVHLCAPYSDNLLLRDQAAACSPIHMFAAGFPCAASHPTTLKARARNHFSRSTWQLSATLFCSISLFLLIYLCRALICLLLTTSSMVYGWYSSTHTALLFVLCVYKLTSERI